MTMPKSANSLYLSATRKMPKISAKGSLRPFEVIRPPEVPALFLPEEVANRRQNSVWLVYFLATLLRQAFANRSSSLICASETNHNAILPSLHLTTLNPR